MANSSSPIARILRPEASRQSAARLSCSSRGPPLAYAGAWREDMRSFKNLCRAALSGRRLEGGRLGSIGSDDAPACAGLAEGGEVLRGIGEIKLGRCNGLDPRGM